MSEPFNDQTLQRALLAEVPDRRPEYWDQFDRLLEQAAAPGTEGDAGSRMPDTSVADISAKHALTVRWHSRWSRQLALAAASIVVIALLMGVQVLRSDDTTVDTGFATDPRLVELEQLPGPAVLMDHWNAVYGVWDCTAIGDTNIEDGASGWLAPFTSAQDDLGIHSHGDGLISIHPFVEESAGRNATFQHFADSMNVAVTDTSITLDDGRVLQEGALCDGEPAVLQLLRWSSAPDLERDPSIEPIVITEAFNEQRFFNDLEVWTLAFAPHNAEVPLPPADRFDQLAGWWFLGDTTVEAIATLTSDELGVYAVPPSDGMGAVRLIEEGATLNPQIADIHIQSHPPGAVVASEIIPGSGRRWEAVSPQSRSIVNLLSFEVHIPASDFPSTLFCNAVVWVEPESVATARCSREEPRPGGSTSVQRNTYQTIESVALWNAPADGFWMMVTTTENQRFLAGIVDGVSHTAWPARHGAAERVDILDSDLNMVWSQDQ